MQMVVAATADLDFKTQSLEQQRTTLAVAEVDVPLELQQLVAVQVAVAQEVAQPQTAVTALQEVQTLAVVAAAD